MVPKYIIDVLLNSTYIMYSTGNLLKFCIPDFVHTWDVHIIYYLDIYIPFVKNNILIYGIIYSG